jgi:putative membrane protein insertion efficiency factor
VFAKTAIYLLRIYKKYLSPAIPGARCRFIPTCSQYGIEAISKHGIIKGGFMLFVRLLKCNPLGPYGYDNVK